MKIDLNSINQEEFFVSERENGILVFSKKNKFKWTIEELPLRSLLCDKEGNVLSSGFPKFFNYGENQAYDELFMSAIEQNSNNARYAPKIDGSLIIRDVIDGKVNFRTRGSHTLTGTEEDQFNGEAVLDLISNQYCWLLNPAIGKNISILHEYTAPNNHIVIKYNEPKLTFLGCIDKETGNFMLPISNYSEQMNELGCESESIQLRPLPHSLNEMQSEVKGWNGKEGIVIYVPYKNTYLLTKMKSDWYFKLHAILTGVSINAFGQLMWDNHLFSLEAFETYLYQQGYDFEVYAHLKPRADEWLDTVERAKETLVNLKTRLKELGIFELETRKEKAFKIQEITKTKEEFTLGLWMLDGKEDVYIGMQALNMTRTQFQGYEREKTKCLK